MERHGSDDEGCVSGSREHEQTLVVAVEGNIGCGKSTFLEYCASRPGIDVFPEPIEKWRDVGGENLLVKFYENPRMWAMAFQLQVGMTVLDIYEASSMRAIKMIERSLLSSRYCFLENMRRTGLVEPATFHVLDGWYERALGGWRSKPHAIVYLRTTPIVAHNRLLHRARGEELQVDLGYITQLHDLHEEWLDREQNANISGEADMPIHVIDADMPLERMYGQYEECLQFLDLLNA